MFYNLIIQPLVLIFDIVFVSLYDFFGLPGVAIIFLNIIVNLIALPLYRQADRIQKGERLKQEKMKPWVEKIKTAFSGDEQYMMLSAYYRVEHYSPASVLKETFPLLLQIPIFMAAYRYLSNNPILIGTSFGPIKDLGSPDRLLTIAGVTINVLPVLMTLLNLVSGAVYTKGKGLWLKIQAFGLAVVFLVLLYNGPAGLALYWTMSQVFSIVKNLLMETDILKQRKVMLPLSIITIFVAMICTTTRVIKDRAGEVIAEILLLLSVIYLVRVVFELKNKKLPNLKGFLSRFPQVKYGEYIAVCFALFALLGLCIPASVLSTSVSEFIDTTTGNFQSFLLTYPLTVYAGLLLVWTSIYYFFTGKTGRRIIFCLLLILLGAGLVNYFAFDIKPEFYYTDLTFDGNLEITRKAEWLNLFCMAAVVAVLILLWIKKQTVLKNLTIILTVSLIILGVYQAAQIPQAMKTVVLEDDAVTDSEGHDLTGVISLSKTKKNVLVLMMDRALSGQLPFIFEEFPTLKEDFEGFVYYPNTLSFGTHTKIGAPPLYGGYEYTPETLAANSDKKNPDVARKEAVKVLPVLFAENGYQSIVCDPSFIGKDGFADCQGVSAYKLKGVFSKEYASLFDTNIIPRQKHNFLVFPIYKTSPLFVRDYIYDDGDYMQAETSSLGYTQAFIDNYTTLKEYVNLTATTDSDQGSFVFIVNDTTHEPTLLEPPDYEITPDKVSYDIPYGERTIDGVTMKIEDLTDWKHYCVNVLSYREIAKWLNSMKALGVYDNTRIIIVSDHGMQLNQFKELSLDGFDAQEVNPLLLVKDYDASGPIQISMEFMTNADVPSLALEGTIDNPVNPFTGNPLSDKDKTEKPVWVEQGVKRIETLTEDKVLGVDDYIWWEVNDNIFDKNNWKRIE